MFILDIVVGAGAWRMLQVHRYVLHDEQSILSLLKTSVPCLNAIGVEEDFKLVSYYKEEDMTGAFQGAGFRAWNLRFQM